MIIKVFVSSTTKDLLPYRKAAIQALERLDNQVDRVEVFGTRPEESIATPFREVEASDIFVGIYAHMYGYIPNNSTLSITEQEFDYAMQLMKLMFCFIIDDDYPWPPMMIEAGPGESKLRAFKAKFKTALAIDLFTTPEDLAVKIATAVGRYLSVWSSTDFKLSPSVSTVSSNVNLFLPPLLH